MHAYIDKEVFAGLQVDAALRQLLKTFRLPGEPMHLLWPRWRLAECSLPETAANQHPASCVP